MSVRKLCCLHVFIERKFSFPHFDLMYFNICMYIFR